MTSFEMEARYNLDRVSETNVKNNGDRGTGTSLELASISKFGKITVPDDPRISGILDSVCQSYGIGTRILFSRLRSNNLLEARLVVISRLQKECRMSCQDIGVIMHRSGASVSRRMRTSRRLK